MKKQIIAVVLISGLAIATAASANWGRGGGRAGYNGYCPMVQGQAFQQVDPAVQEKLDKFYLETQDLRKQMVVKQAERRALMQGQNPDPAVASRLAGELFDLSNAIQEKAVAAGVDQYVGPRMMGNAFGGGMGPGMGPYGGGRGGRMMGGPNY